MPDQSPRTEVDAIVEATRRVAQEPIEVVPGVLGMLVIPDDHHTETTNLEQLAEAPRRKRGRFVFHTPEAFAAYIVVHREPQEDSETPNRTTIWGNVDKPGFVAILDDHGQYGPAWADHRAVLDLRLTKEWRRWTAQDGKYMPQVAFAELIEDGLGEIAEPPGAQLLELAQTFQATQKSAFTSDQRLDNGDIQFRYETETTATAGRQGNLQVPPSFTLVMAPFEGAAQYTITARVRYRITEGRLALAYILDHPEKVLEQAFDDVADTIAATTEVAVWRGVEPTSARA